MEKGLKKLRPFSFIDISVRIFFRRLLVVHLDIFPLSMLKTIVSWIHFRCASVHLGSLEIKHYKQRRPVKFVVNQKTDYGYERGGTLKMTLMTDFTILSYVAKQVFTVRLHQNGIKH